ncbi:beta-lactamase/transpeptidase-like protein [Apodospora peruviana]|uniref:Beta-lactamase/transpeptidase-like protein n=1 Tax=Apodospora peruviana TaxID=516989 RepID=A0AAE0LZ71_9PEZI|nr:beta-lactamase/transpeptidase-like protein [Apodospora peruviana]
MDENISLSTTGALNTSAIAIGVKSIHEDKLLLEYAYTPDEKYRDPRGMQKVDSDTVFRLASLSKVFTMLAVLQQNGTIGLEDPITKFVPELKDLHKQAREDTPIWTVDWERITIGALASHLGGIGADLPTDIAEVADFEEYGFPPRNDSRLLHCSGFFGQPECDRSVFFARFGERPPVQLPFSPNTVYSNIGFALLGFAVESVTQKHFVDYLDDEIWGPLGMTHTFATKPDDDSLLYIPRDDIWWNATLGFESPAGAYYSSINDLHKFGDALLQHRLLDDTATRKWLKPVTETSSSGQLIGQPWEIFRTQNVTVDGRLIEFYTKGGDIKTYHSILALIPDYDLVASVLISGAATSGYDVLLIFSQLAQALLPAIEKAGKEENEVVFVGTYTDEATNSTISFSIDDAPGLNIATWVVRGVDVLTTAGGLDLPPVFPPPVTNPVRFRLYPTTVKTDRQSSWRAMPSGASAEETAAFDSQFVWAMASCSTWAAQDRVVYMLQSYDHFVFTLDEEGKKATNVELVGYGVTLTRQD